MPVILNVEFAGLLNPATTGLAPGLASLYTLFFVTQFADIVKVKDTTQIINGISSSLQKLLKYFKGTTISTFFVVSILFNFPVMLVL